MSGTPSAKVRVYALATLSALMVVGCALIPVLVPLDPNMTDVAHAYSAPGSNGYVLGSDSVGRDVWVRTLFGGAESVPTSLVIVVLSLVLGSGVGIAAGYRGGAADAVLDKVVTMFQAFPSLVLAIALAAILGPGTANMVCAVVAVKWTEFARLSRTLARSVKGADYVRAARVCGAEDLAIIRRYLLPNMASSLIVMAALSAGDVVLTMAGLSFLGLGPARPTNEWGALMSEQRSSFQFAPWCILVPAMALFVTVTVFNLLGDALRDTLDTRGLRYDNGHPGEDSPQETELCHMTRKGEL